MELKPTNKIPPGKIKDHFNENSEKLDRAHLGETPNNSAISHYRSDSDSSQQALHHSLGINRNQASPGNHIHDGTSSSKLGEMKFDATPGNEGKIVPLEEISGSRGGNEAVASIIALLHKFVNFTDNTTA